MGSFVSQIMKFTYIYNISWEDPRIDRELLQLTPRDRIFVLCSAGCNVLDYLLESPVEIVTCDINKFQLHLLQLKLSMLQDENLTFNEWWEIWGDSNVQTAVRVYKRIRKRLTSDAEEWWDARLETIFRGKYYTSGSAGWFVKKVLPVIFRWSGMSMDEFRRYARRSHEEFAGRLQESGFLMNFSSLLEWVFNDFICKLIGVPPSQIVPGAATREFFVWLWSKVFIEDKEVFKENYFYRFYLLGNFSKECCPRYLKQENFNLLKKNCTRVRWHWESSLDALKHYPDGYFSKLALLDHQDWLSNEAIQEEWSALQQKSSPNAKVLWRSAGPDMISSIPFLRSIRGMTQDVSKDVYERDRVKTYMGTYVASIPESIVIPRLTTDLEMPVGYLMQLRCVIQMLCYPLLSARMQIVSHADRMEDFYSSQKEGYDNVRERFLCGRKVMMSMVGPFDTNRSKRSWLDIGGGTGRNIHYLREYLEYFEVIAVVDICASLLEAGKRHAKEVLREEDAAKIEWICADATDEWEMNKVLIRCKVKSFDIVTCSYSLSMIPNWRRAVDIGKELCREKFVVGDFDSFTEDGVGVKDWLLRKWFAQDNVRIEGCTRKYLRSKFAGGFEKRWTESGLLPFLHVPHFIFYAEKVYVDRDV